MSLETLLEAAEFIDCERDNEGGTRAAKNATTDFHPYAKHPKYKFTPLPQPPTTQESKTDEESTSGKQLVMGSSLVGNRSLHNRLEKNRRAQLKSCFEQLKNVLPQLEDRKASNLFILKSAVRQIQTLRRQETELEMEMQKVARQKIMNQERIAVLFQEVNMMDLKVDLSTFTPEEDAHSTSTATADGEDPILSDDDGQSSSTLSTTSTPNTSALAFQTQSPLKSPSQDQKPVLSPVTAGNRHATTVSGLLQTSDTSIKASGVSGATTPGHDTANSMQSILNRTLLAATTNVLTSLTGAHHTVSASGRSMQGGLQINTGGKGASVASASDSAAKKVDPSAKLSVNQILQHTLLQRNLQHHQLIKALPQEELKSPKPLLLATQVQNADTQLAGQSKATTATQLRNGPVLLGNAEKLLSGGGKIGKQSVSTLLSQSGPATIAKLVSQKELNCDMQSGGHLSSLTSAHLSIPVSSPVVTATPKHPPSAPLTSPPSQQQPTPLNTTHPVKTTITLAELLPSVYSSTTGNQAKSAASSASQPSVTVTTHSVNSAVTSQIASLAGLGNIALTTGGLAGGQTATGSNQGIQVAGISNQPQQPPQPVVAMNQLITAPVQAITQEQLQQLLQASLVQQQLNLQLQQQKLVSLASSLSQNALPPATVATLDTVNQLASLARGSVLNAPATTQTASVSSTSTQGLGQLNLSALPLTPLISPISIVSPNVQLASLNQVTSQVLNTQLGQIPILQQPTLSLPFKPLVVLPTKNTQVAPNTDVTESPSKTHS